MLKLNEFRDRAHKNGVKLGHWDALYNDNVEASFVLMFLEVDAMYILFSKESLVTSASNNIQDNFKHRLAELIIRTLDLCGELNIDVDKIMKKCTIEILTTDPFANARTMMQKILVLHDLITFAVTDDTGSRSDNDNSMYDSESIVRILIATLELARYSNIDMKKYLKNVIEYKEKEE